MSIDYHKRLSEDLSGESLAFLSERIRSISPSPTKQHIPYANRFKERWKTCMAQIYIDHTVRAVMSRAWIPYLLVIAASVTIGGVIGYKAADYNPLFADQSLKSLGSCGITSKENRGSNCVYDLMVGSWIDSRCHDKRLYAKYVEQIRELNLTYFDQDGITEIPLDIALQGDHPVLYTSGVHHHLHCTYYWEMQWIAWKYGGLGWDSYTLSEKHTMHCIWANGQPKAEQLHNRTVTRVHPPDKRIECMIR